jgi:hypothetical protein
VCCAACQPAAARERLRTVHECLLLFPPTPLKVFAPFFSLFSFFNSPLLVHRLRFLFLYHPTSATAHLPTSTSCMDRYPIFEFRPPRDFPPLPPSVLSRRTSSHGPPYKNSFKAVKTFIGVPETGGFRRVCGGVPLRIDSDD